MKVYFSTPGARLSFSFSCRIRNVPRKQNTTFFHQNRMQARPSCLPSSQYSLGGDFFVAAEEKTAWAGRGWMKTPPLAQGEGLGWVFGIFTPAPLATPLNLLLITPVLEQEHCKLKFHPFMATGICFHCVNIFNASSCKSLPKPFPPSLIFSIMRFPDSCSTSKALSTPMDFARGLGLSLKRLEFFFLQEISCRCPCVLSHDRTNSGLFCSRGTFRAWHTNHHHCGAAGVTEHGRSLQ